MIAKVAAIAARGVPGVVALGGGGSQLLGAARRGVTGDDTRERESSAGVRVEREERAARLAMEIVVEYGAGAETLVRSLRRAVRDAVEQMVDVPGRGSRHRDRRRPAPEPTRHGRLRISRSRPG